MMKCIEAFCTQINTTVAANHFGFINIVCFSDHSLSFTSFCEPAPATEYTNPPPSELPTVDFYWSSKPNPG
jgi:hypothetical protein